MRINDKELAELSFGKSVIEGRLHHKRLGGNRSQTGFKERWFKLRYNVLFYFNLSDSGTILDKKPAGAIVLENCVATNELMDETPFMFSLKFRDECDRKHVFSGRSEDSIINWVTALNMASYETWRSKLKDLQTQLKYLTGQDPLIMFYRNECSRENFLEQRQIGLRKKTGKNPSFLSYCEKFHPETEECTEGATDAGLQFCEDYFGVANDQDSHNLSNYSTSRNLQNTSSSQSETPPFLESGAKPSTAIARPRPLRKAPEPPTRPPRGQKVNSCSVVDSNLIEL